MAESVEQKPRKRRKDARPAEIIAAGLTEFAEQGFERTRLEDIAQRAGIAKSTIYLYFKNKEAVFAAAVEAHMELTLGELETLVDGFEGSTETLLQLILGKLYSQVAEGSATTIMRTMIAEGPRFPELVDLYYARVISPAEVLMGRVLQRGVERGEVRETAVTQYHRIIAAPAIMLSVWNILFNARDPVDPDRYFLEHMDLLMRGLRP